MVMVSGDHVVAVSFRLCHLIVALARDVAHAPSILPQLLHVNGHVCSLVPGCFRWIFWKHCHRYSLRLVLFHGHISSVPSSLAQIRGLGQDCHFKTWLKARGRSHSKEISLRSSRTSNRIGLSCFCISQSLGPIR